jgi:hypothetical protein
LFCSIILTDNVICQYVTPVSSKEFILWCIALGNLKMLDSYLSPRINKRTERLDYWIYSCFHVKCLGGIYSDCFKCELFCLLECRPLLWICPTPFVWGWGQIQFPTGCVFYTRWWIKSNPKFLPLFPIGLFNRMLIRPPLVIWAVLLVFPFFYNVTTSTIFSTVSFITRQTQLRTFLCSAAFTLLSS